MKRRDLLRAIDEAAKAAGLPWTLVREGASHELWELDGTRVTIPRHRAINELTALGILRELDAKLGKDWWRR